MKSIPIWPIVILGGILASCLSNDKEKEKYGDLRIQNTPKVPLDSALRVNVSHSQLLKRSLMEIIPEACPVEIINFRFFNRYNIDSIGFDSSDQIFPNDFRQDGTLLLSSHAIWPDSLCNEYSFSFEFDWRLRIVRRKDANTGYTKPDSSFLWRYMVPDCEGYTKIQDEISFEISHKDSTQYSLYTDYRRYSAGEVVNRFTCP